jgi:hypothetical protein
MVVLHEVYLKRGILRTNVSLLPPDFKEYLLVSTYVLRDEMEYPLCSKSKFQQVTVPARHKRSQKVIKGYRRLRKVTASYGKL